MNNEYKKVFDFSISQLDFSTRINLDEKKLVIIQIFSFELSENNFDYISSFVDNLSDNMTVYIDDIDTSSDKFKLNQSCLNDEVEISIQHSLSNIDYPLLVANQEDFYEIIETCTNVLEIKDIEKINNVLLLKITDEDIVKEVQLKTDLDVLLDDSKYASKGILILPNILQNEYWHLFSQKIIVSFFNCVSERILAEREYLIKIGNVSSVKIPQEVSLPVEQIEYIYSIVRFIFSDKNRYEDKLQILRKVMTDYFNRNSNLENTNWKEVFQVLKDSYSLFIDRKIDTFFETEQKLFEQSKKISDDIAKDIDTKIDELPKQILAILATVISSFVLKISDEQRLLFLGLAILYSVTLLAMNAIKGFYFSSDNVKKRKEKIKESLKLIVSAEKLNEFESASKPALDKLCSIERFQKFFLILVVVALVISFIIA